MTPNNTAMMPNGVTWEATPGLTISITVSGEITYVRPSDGTVVRMPIRISHSVPLVGGDDGSHTPEPTVALGDLTQWNAQYGALVKRKDDLHDRRDALEATSSAGGGGNPFVYLHAATPAALVQLNAWQREIDQLGVEIRAHEAQRPTGT